MQSTSEPSGLIGWKPGAGWPPAGAAGVPAFAYSVAAES